MSYTKTDAYNLMLVMNGELPMSSYEEQEDMSVARLSTILEQVHKEELRKLHNFNSYEQDLVPDQNGLVSISSQMLAIYFAQADNERLVLRDNVIWNRDTNAAHNQKVRVLINSYVDFEACPEIFREYVAYKAVQQYIACFGKGPDSAAYARSELKVRKASVSFYNSEHHKVPSRYGLLYAVHGTVGLVP